jgi:hypothetical protein
MRSLITEFIEWDEMQRQLVEAGRFSQVHANGGLVRKISNPEAAQGCLDLLGELGAQVEHNGFYPSADETILTALYGEFDFDHWERTLFNSYRL